MSSSPSPASRHDAVQLERRDRDRGRVINRSAALQKRREEFAANARPVGAGTSTIYDWTTALNASPVQLKAFDGAIGDLHDAVSVGNHEVWGDPLPAHLQYRKNNKEPDADTADAHTIAKRGVGGPGSPLPHGEVIQKAFGRHDLSDVKAHLGGHAQEASAALGAEAYATGSDIAFAGSPTLHTTAHEAAHIIQQRAGVSLKGGVGESGDKYERHADAVADAVVQGKSAEDLLDQMSGAGSENGSVQRRAIQREATEKCVLPGDVGAEFDCAPGDQEKLDRNDGESSAAARVAGSPTVVWNGPLEVSLRGFPVDKADLDARHKDALGTFVAKAKSTLNADPRIIELASKDLFPHGEPPWWEMITEVVGSTSPEGTEDKNYDLAGKRAGNAEEQLFLRMPQSTDYKTRVKSKPTTDKKVPKSAWPALRSATIRAAPNERIFDVVSPSNELQETVGKLPPPRGAARKTEPSAGTKNTGSGASPTHEFKGVTNQKVPSGRAKGTHQHGVTLNPNGGAISYKYEVDKTWPFPVFPGVFVETGIAGAIAGAGAADLSAKTLELALEGTLTGSLTLNGGLPDMGPVKASVYGGAEGKMVLKGSLSFDHRNNKEDAKASGALCAALKIGVKAGCDIPAKYLPKGWAPVETAFQYEYKPTGDLELAFVDFSNGEVTIKPGKDIERIKQWFEDLHGGLRSFGDYLAKTDPLPNRRESYGVGTGSLGGRNLE